MAGGAQVMVACPGCGRTFSGQDRCDIHVRGCKAAQEMGRGGGGLRECIVPGGGGGVGGAGERPKTVSAKPRACLCYICGKEFGTTSIGIHEKQCARKFEAQQELLPEHQRKRLPERPDVDDGAGLVERNEAAQKAYEDQVRFCEMCRGGLWRVYRISSRVGSVGEDRVGESDVSRIDAWIAARPCE